MAARLESLVGAQQRLVRDVSHELRSPLTRLNIALDLARRKTGDASSDNKNIKRIGWKGACTANKAKS